MSTTPTTNATGGCLCGAVRYQVDGPLRRVVYCHCEQCRRTSGHFVAATACNSDHLSVSVDDGLRWYRSSSFAQRGFCGLCGASVFWRPDHEDYMSIMAGTIDGPTGLDASTHIFVAFASDYYSIDDGLPQHDESSREGLTHFEE